MRRNDPAKSITTGEVGIFCFGSNNRGTMQLVNGKIKHYDISDIKKIPAKEWLEAVEKEGKK